MNLTTTKSMAFKLVVHAGSRTGMEAFCDVCGECIKNPGMANILWRSNRPFKDENVGDKYDFFIACKDRCTQKIDAIFGHQYSQELDTGIGYLLRNLNFDFESVESRIGTLSLID